MMPLAPTPIVPVPSKPKIGFSIDSIVGGGRHGHGRSASDDETTTGSTRLDIERDDASPMDVSSATRPRLSDARSPGAHSEESDRPPSRSSSVESYPNSGRTPLGLHLHHSGQHHPPHHHQNHHRTTSHHLSPQQRPMQLDYSARSLTTQRSHSGGSTPNHDSPSPPAPSATVAHRLAAGRNSESPGSGGAVGPGHPQPPPGVVRPSPNYLGPPPGAASAAAAAAVAAEQLKSLYGLPGAGHGVAGPQAQSEYHAQQQLALNIAAAQHFQAANLAVALQAHHGPPHGPYGHAGGPPGPHPPPHPHQPPRDSYPLYPWLLSRHGRIFPQRFPGGESLHQFISISVESLPAFRKLIGVHSRNLYCVNKMTFIEICSR
ncbi:hypothetical protein QAD02_022048 [Eretmocerus hayati]|uniref:Uncharacterized protein n=1 Tax=Eretmocerus hayati TaxID=131215 RepID=A0ACC2PUE8_9HYME|nr:hypothetical protein QAD02_022048 [Eretmocerus hayati]